MSGILAPPLTKRYKCPFCGEELENTRLVEYSAKRSVIVGRCPYGNHKITIMVEDWEDE